MYVYVYVYVYGYGYAYVYVYVLYVYCICIWICSCITYLDAVSTQIFVFMCRSSISYEIFTFTAIGAQDQMGAEVFPLLLPSDAAATQLDDRSFSKIEGYTVKSWMV